MTNSDRFNRMEDQLIDMRLAVSALLETATQHQRNFETIQRNFETLMTEIRDIKLEIRDIKLEIRDIKLEIRDIRADMREMQSDIRGSQTENRRILDILQHRSDEQEGDL